MSALCKGPIVFAVLTTIDFYVKHQILHRAVTTYIIIIIIIEISTTFHAECVHAYRLFPCDASHM
jgi:hypothetical protein